MSWEQKKILFVLILLWIVLYISLLLLSHNVTQHIGLIFFHAHIFLFQIISLFTHRLDHVDINYHTILYQFNTLLWQTSNFQLRGSHCVNVLHMLLLTSEALAQISMEFPLSTNQQSFYRHGSDSYLGNINLRFLHIVIQGSSTPQEDI